MTWLTTKAQWVGHDYSTAGLQHGKTYDLQYAIDGYRILVRLTTHQGPVKREYPSLARFAKEWKLQPKR